MGNGSDGPVAVPGPRQQVKSPSKIRREAYIHELRALIARLQHVDFNSHIRPLRPGHKATILVPQKLREYQRGGVNIHIPVHFDDGLKWIIRIKQTYVVAFGHLPPEVRRLTAESEVETMRVLRSAGMAVPRVYGDVIGHGQRGRILLLRMGRWHALYRPNHQGYHRLNRAEVVIRQLAQFYIDLSALTFPYIGSLYPAPQTAVPIDHPSPGDFTLGRRSHFAVPNSIIGPSVSLKYRTSQPPYFYGPFQTSAERYLANIQQVLTSLRNGEGDIHGAKSLGDPRIAYVVHLWLADLVRSVPQLNNEDEEIMLRHADDKGDHLFQNEDGGLKCVIDWEWAITAPKSEAFAPPPALMDLEAFASGSNALSQAESLLAEAYDEFGRPDLAACIRGTVGKLHQRLRGMIGLKPQLAMIKGLEGVMLVMEAGDLVGGAGVAGGQGGVGTLEEWYDVVRERYADDEGLSGLGGGV